jgi:uncharacterized cysteine cluster protein YcgN (CxxCxxCC family)
MVTEDKAFWNTKRLDELTPAEWELLCDGCGRCCLHKLEDIDNGLIFYTRVACRLLDEETCRCTNYAHRLELVKDCIVLDASSAIQYEWLPRSCAYRTYAEGRPLEWWHPLISGNSDSVKEAGISVVGRIISENSVASDDFENHIINWIDI